MGHFFLLFLFLARCKRYARVLTFEVNEQNVYILLMWFLWTWYDFREEEKQ